MTDSERIKILKEWSQTGYNTLMKLSADQEDKVKAVMYKSRADAYGRIIQKIKELEII